MRLLWFLVLCAVLVVVKGVRVPHADRSPSDDLDAKISADAPDDRAATQNEDDDVPPNTLHLLLHRLHDERQRLASGLEDCTRIVQEFHAVAHVAFQVRHQAVLVLDQLQYQIAHSPDADGGVNAVETRALIQEKIHAMMSLLTSGGMIELWNPPGDGSAGGEEERVDVAPEVGEENEGERRSGEEHSKEDGGDRTPQNIRLSGAFLARLEALQDVCRGKRDADTQPFVRWLAANPAPLEYGRETTALHMDIVQACYATVDSVKVLDRLAVREVVDLLFQWIGEFVNGKRRTITTSESTRLFGIADALALFGLLQRLVGYLPEASYDGGALFNVPAGTLMWEYVQGIVRGVQSATKELDSIVQGSNVKGPVITSRRVVQTSDEQQRSHEDQPKRPTDGGDRKREEPKPAHVKTVNQLLVEAAEELQRRQRQAAGGDSAAGHQQPATMPPGAEASLFQKIMEAMRATQQQPQESPPQGEGAVASQPQEPPEYADVQWLHRDFVRTVPLTHTSGEEGVLLPLPYHSSINDALKSNPAVDGAAALCSAGAAISGGIVRRPYAGILQVAPGNLAAITTLVDEALLYVYRDWDANAQEQLDILHNAFNYTAYGTHRWFGDEEGGCVLTLVPGMFDDLLRPRPEGVDSMSTVRSPCILGTTGERTTRGNTFIRIPRLDAASAPHPPQASDAVPRKIQAVLALNLAYSGQIVPHLRDLTNPGLYFFRRRTLGTSFTHPWTTEHLQRFVREHIASGLVLGSAREFEVEVLARPEMESAVLFLVPEEPEECEAPTADLPSLSSALLDDSNKLRTAVASACGRPCWVHILNVKDASAASLPKGLHLTEVPAGDSHTRDEMQRPLPWAVDSNPYLTQVADLGVDDVTFPNLAQSQWRHELGKLRLAQGCSPPVYMMLLRKVKDDRLTGGRAQFAVASLRFPGPTSMTPRTEYARFVGNHFIKFLRSVHQPHPGLVENPVSARTLSSALRTPNSGIRYVFLYMASGPAAQQAVCLRSLRRASMSLRDLQAGDDAELDDRRPREGKGYFRFGVVNATIQPSLFYELGVASTYISGDEGSTSALLGHTPPFRNEHEEEEGAHRCEVLIAHLPTAALEWWGGVDPQNVEKLATALFQRDELNNAWFVTRTDAPAESTSRSVSNMLDAACDAWDVRHRHAKQHATLTSPVGSSFSLPSQPGWAVATAGKRQFPVLQFHQRSGPGEESEHRMDVVLLYDKSCALSVPALVGFQQLLRCGQEVDAVFGVRQKGAFDARNVSSVRQHFPWAWDVLTSLVPNPADLVLPMLLVGSVASHTVTLPSPWTWNGQLRGLLDLLEAEQRQRWGPTATRSLCTGTRPSSGGCKAENPFLWRECIVHGGKQRRNAVAKAYRSGIRRPLPK